MHIVGVYGTLVKIEAKSFTYNLIPPDYDYILLIDTEGLLSIEKGDEQYDKRLILFCLAISHLVIVNVKGEINETLKQMLLLCTQSLKYLGETHITRSTVHFVLNQRSDPNKANCERQLKIIQDDLIAHGLNNLIDLGANNFHILPTAFNSNEFEDPNVKNCVTLSTNIKFVTDVQNLCKLFVDLSFKIIHDTGNHFSIPTKWIEYANSVFQIIKKYPDLTYFKDIFEREQNNKIRQEIRIDLEKYLSPTEAQLLINKEKTNNRYYIQDSFRIEQERIFRILEKNLEEKITKYAVSENVRQRSIRFLQVQVAIQFRSWEVSAIMAGDRDKLNKMMQDNDSILRQFAIDTLSENLSIDRSSAVEEFETMWKNRFASIESKFDSEVQWKQSIELVCRLYDVFNQDALPSLDNILTFLPFLVTLDRLDETDVLHESLLKIRNECTCKASNINFLVSQSTTNVYKICLTDLQKQYTYLNIYEFLVIPNDNDSKSTAKRWIRSDLSKDFCQEINNNWQTIVRVSYCFETFIVSVHEIFKLKINDEPSTGIILLQDILGIVNKLIQDMNQELNIFNVSISKSFESILHICAVLSIALFYYHQQKTHFNSIIKSIEQNKAKWQHCFIRMVSIQENDNENIANDLVDQFLEILFQSFDQQKTEIHRKYVENERATLNWYYIMKELDNEVYEATDDWLMRYVLHPTEIIIERFDQRWTKLETKIRQQFNIYMNSHLETIDEFFHVIKGIKISLKLNDENALTLVDDIFEPSSNSFYSNPFDKKLCMAKLINQYLSGEPIPAQITVKNDATYTLQRKWQEIINTMPLLSDQLKDIFRSMKSTFETYTIIYTNTFLDKIISQQTQKKEVFRTWMTAFVESSCCSTRERLQTQLRGCQAQCPCCKRLCDVDHRLNNAIPAGQGENRHQCQSGHQIRGMSGIRYELTNEASTLRCEMIKDNDAIVTSRGRRQKWIDFKNIHDDWNFGDPRIREIQNTSCTYIWSRIGEQLCQNFGNGMKFVKQNSPLPTNHFIFLLDHSGSMNQTSSISKNITCQRKLTPWEHLLKAVREFIQIRIQNEHHTDQLTFIVFGRRAKRVYDREKIDHIDVDRLNMSMSTCGKSTNFNAVFNKLIETLDEIRHDPMCNNFRQIIIFLTDGEPYFYPTSELECLSMHYKSMIAHFWIMGLGNYNKKMLHKISEDMQGQLMDIKESEDLIEAYSEIANES
ncbi:unnamed protein product [Rotaria sp. Silwood2]|nr:unnamed protein product [Rotaria sp. Silwood2]